VRRFDRSFLAAEIVRYEVVNGPMSDESIKAIAGVAADYLLGYPVRIDPTIGDGPDVFPCPTPHPAGVPDAEQRIRADARNSSEHLT
jgi:hypothetical protein